MFCFTQIPIEKPLVTAAVLARLTSDTAVLVDGDVICAAFVLDLLANWYQPSPRVRFTLYFCVFCCIMVLGVCCVVLYLIVSKLYSSGNAWVHTGYMYGAYIYVTCLLEILIPYVSAYSWLQLWLKL